MGMAASQARFLNLTARKTNIEFHGQQINQQRTELSNASANLYNQMLTLQVPVPPNTQDFVKVQYTFNIPGSYDTLATVTQFSKQPGGDFSVLFTYSETEMGFPACTTKQRSDVSSTTATGTHVYKPYAGVEGYSSGATKILKVGGQTGNLTALQETDEAYKSGYGYYATVNNVKYFITQSDYDAITSTSSSTNPVPMASASKQENGTNYSGSSVITYKGKSVALQNVTADNSAHKDAYDALSNSDAEQVYVANIGTEESPIYQYYKGSEITAAKGSGEDGRVFYYTASDIKVFREDSYSGVTLSRDGNNRVQSFSYKGEDYAVTASTVTDDEAYNQAMNEYTYQSYLYEQEMNNINAKISVIHAQDRELELKLKQLDTEHNAVQTEIDTVQNIAKKNVEDSFKTFG